MTIPPGAIGVPKDRAVGRAIPALPKESAVYVDSLKCFGTVVSHVESDSSVTYLVHCLDGTFKGKDQKVSGRNVFRRDAVDLPETAQAMPPSRSAMHHVFFDPEDVPQPDAYLAKFKVEANDADRKVRKTARGLRLMRDADRTAVFGGGTQPTLGPLVYGIEETFKALAQMRVQEAVYDASGLRFAIKIWCNAEHRAAPYDLMQVFLDFKQDTILDTVAVIAMPAGKNTVEFTASYTWDQLCALFHLPLEKGEVAQTAFTERVPQLGIRVVWLDATETAQRNSINHYSGGLDAKHGSGVVSVRPITLEDLRAAEGVPKLNWNAAEPLLEGRPVFDTFSDLLQPGKELATTLEAESEFQVGEAQYRDVLDKLKTLTGNAETLKSLGIVKAEGGTPIKCIDTYYDTANLDLLRSKIVLRRRSVPVNDEKKGWVFLFACKGATFVNPQSRKEKIRLATQCHLQKGFKLTTLVKFLTDEKNIDNAFARVLRDAMGADHPLVHAPEKWTTLGERIVIESTRTKYSFELEYATTIEFSADEATVTIEGRPITIYSIEFGVGHPGLQVLNTQTTTANTTSGSGGTTAPKMGRAEKILVQRPYHIPTDLKNPALFAKPDYLQFQRLRDQMLIRLFGSADPDLQPGGNKAHTLAGLHKLI
jgi:hypothetical protein